MNWILNGIALVVVILFVAVAVMVSNKSGAANMQEENNYVVTCLDGVEYWAYVSGYKSSLAPRYDAETKQIATCDA